MEIIDVNRKILSQRKEIEIENEFIVPDVKPDMVNIICTNGISYINKQEIQNGVLKFDGNVEATIVYLSGDGDTRSIEAHLDFTQKIENNIIKENSLVKYNISILEISSKMLNERKVAVTAKLEIKYVVYEKQEVKFYNDFENIEGLQKQERTLNINSVIGINKIQTSINEKINVDNIDSVSEILKTDINISNVESKISYNKILAKAEANISLIYLTEDDRISTVKASFPVMSFIEIPNVKEENVCDLDYKMKNIVLRINKTEEHSINCQMDFDIIAEVFEKKTINIVSDLYSLKNDLEYTKNEIDIETEDVRPLETVNVNESFEIDNIKKVLAVDEKLFFHENSSPEIELIIYYETTDKNGLNVRNVRVPIMSKMEKGENCTVNIKKKEFGVDANNVIIKMELEIKKDETSTEKITLIQDIQTKEIENKEDYSVVVYFVKPNDTIWKIAKNFRVTMDSIIRINNLENPDLIYPGDKLYVLK